MSPPLPYSFSMKSEFEPIFKLGRAERLQLVEDLWESLAAEAGQLEISREKREELRCRRKRFVNDPGSGRTWEQVRDRARAGGE